MILRKYFRFWVLVFLVVILVKCTISVSNSSKSKSKFSKTSKAASSRHISAHQYGPLLLKPSKPDPHFEVLDEQRAYNNYETGLREGRAGIRERKPSKLKESSRGPVAAAAAATKSLARASRKEKNKSIFPSPSFVSVESTFQKKSTAPLRERASSQRFLGSQLISGDAGSLTQNMKVSNPTSEKNGWKILMGPSVAPEDEETMITEDDDMVKRSYTSLTDGMAGHHRTITRLKELRGNDKRKYSSRFSSTRQDELPVMDIEKITRSNAVSRAKNDNIGRRSMQVSIPKQALKHKYATITRRAPSKITTVTNKPDRMAKKVPMSITNLNLLDNSIQSKPDSQPYYTSIEHTPRISRIRSSPTMTLDTKKLIIEPVPSSAEPSTFMVGTSTEDREPTPSASAPLQSRYEALLLPPDDLQVGDDGDHDGNNNDHQFNQFQTKTAFNPADYSLVSISTTQLNHHPASFHSHLTEQGGPVISAPSVIPQHHLDAVHSVHHFPDVIPPAELKNAFTEENIPPLPPPRAPVAPPVPLSTSRSPPPLYNGFVGSSSRVPPFRRIPLPLPDFRELDHRFEVVPSVELHNNGFIRTGGYPPLVVPTSKHPPPPPLLQDPLPRPPDPVSSNVHQVVHGPPFSRLPGHHPLPVVGQHNLPHHPGHPLPPHLYPPLDPRHLPRQPLLAPFEIGSARKGGGDQGGKLRTPPPPPHGIDPDHPVVQMALRTPHSLLSDGYFIEPQDSGSS